MEILIGAGADINATDVDGNPVLHEAVWRNQIDVARLLDLWFWYSKTPRSFSKRQRDLAQVSVV